MEPESGLAAAVALTWQVEERPRPAGKDEEVAIAATLQPASAAPLKEVGTTHRSTRRKRIQHLSAAAVRPLHKAIG